MSEAVVIRRGMPEDWPASKALRLRALADSPAAFSSTLERELAFDDEVWRTRLESAATFFAVGRRRCIRGHGHGHRRPA